MPGTTWTQVSQVEYWNQATQTWEAETKNWNEKWTDWTVGRGTCWADIRENWNTVDVNWDVP